MANNLEQNSFVETEKDSELYNKFQNLKPMYASSSEALQSSIRDLESLAAKRGLTIESLLLEAHSTQDTHPHHIQALSLERVIAQLRR